MTREEARSKATALVNRMTLEEMVSQLRYDAPGIRRLGIPEYNWWNEALHGVARAGTATMFPQAIGMAASFDEALLLSVGQVIATEARAKYNASAAEGDRDIYKGLTFWSPNVNIFRDPRWGRGHETYGEDPWLTGRLGVSFIHGLQGDGDSVPYLKTAACAKHFAVHSGPEVLRHKFDAQASPKDLWETYLPAIEDCVTEGQVEAVMGAYNRTNGEPCCASNYLMKDVLRGRWGFQGHYVSDCWAIRDFHENHRITKNYLESAAMAVNAGCDVNCGCTYQKLMDAYQKGLVSRQAIRESAIRLFTTRYLLGMFEPTPYDAIDYSVVECPEHLKIARKAAEESIVLLKNNGLLPLNKDKLKTIGVIGPNADSRIALCGNYYGTSSRYITVLEGIQDYVGDDVRVLYSEGCELSRDNSERLSEAATVAKHSDVVVLCLGLDETLEGEEGGEGIHYFSGDKKDLRLPECQYRLLETVIATGRPFVVCMLAGSAVDMNRMDETAGAIVQAWYPGARGGRSVADILFGAVSPSGKLPLTFYRSTEDLPEFTDYSMKNRTYRYYTGSPLYPFGYGLTYGNTGVVSARADASFEAACAQGVTLRVEVRNDSPVPTDDVLQVYVKVRGTENEVRHHRLCAVKRLSFGPGEEKTVEITVPAKAFRVVNQAGERVYEGTGAALGISFGQCDGRTEELTGKKTVWVEL